MSNVIFDNLTLRSSIEMSTPLLSSCVTSTSVWGQIRTRKLSLVLGGKSVFARNGESTLSQGVGLVALVEL